jgi:Fic family protein
MTRYQPPFTITPTILRLAEEIGESLGHWSVSAGKLSPKLRRGNRIRTIQASLAIENNTLSVEQVTAVLAGKRVLGQPREIQEVRNAFAAYEQMNQWQPSSIDDLLAAHGVLMAGLLDEVGQFRSGKVGIYRGETLVHMAPPAKRVPGQMRELLDWLVRSEVSPLVASCVFHYEFEFIHPFADGNGRMGRLWQTLILSRWKPLLAYLPVETVIREQQAAYYQALTESDQAAEATPFVTYMLQALLTAMREVALTDQVSDQVSDQVKRLLAAFRGAKTLKAAELMDRLGLQHRPTFRNNYLTPALAAGLIAMTDPDSPRSPAQQYRLTSKGQAQ